MPLFYTHVLNGTGYAIDHEGQEFASLDDARHNALVSAGQILSHEIVGGSYSIDLEMHVHDASDTRLLTLPVTARVTGLD